MITYELLGKLRLENTSLLTRVDQLQVRIEAAGNPELLGDVRVLRRELHDHLCLVDALVDALMPDAPRTASG
jgi:hypothetical protein